VSDYFGRLLGRTFDKPAITPRVRARFEPESEDQPEVDVERAPIEVKEESREPDAAAASRAEDAVHAAAAAELQPEAREPTLEPTREVIKEKTRVVREHIVREPSARRSQPSEHRPEPIEEDDVGDAPELALPPPKIVAPPRRATSPTSPRLDQQRTPKPSAPTRASAPQINEPQIIERSTIKVTIGRVELRAPATEEKKSEKPKEQQSMMLTLEDYVRDRKEGRR